MPGSAGVVALLGAILGAAGPAHAAAAAPPPTTPPAAAAPAAPEAKAKATPEPELSAEDRAIRDHQERERARQNDPKVRAALARKQADEARAAAAEKARAEKERVEAERKRRAEEREAIAAEERARRADEAAAAAQRKRAADERAAAERAAQDTERKRAADERAAAAAAERSNSTESQAAAAAERRRQDAERAAAEEAQRARIAAAAAAAAADRKRAADERAAAAAAEAERSRQEEARKRAEAERVATEERSKAAAEKAAAEKAAEEAQARALAERAAAEKAAAEAKAAAEKAAAEAKARAAADRAAAEKAAADAKAAAAKAAEDAKAAAARAADDARARAAAEKAAADAAASKAAADRAAAEAKSQQDALQADLATARQLATSGAFAALLVRRQGTAVARDAETELQRAVLREAATWLTAGAPAASEALIDLPLAKAPASLRDDLAALRGNGWRALAPKAVVVEWTLRNPTGRPMMAHLELAGQRQHVLVPANAPLQGRSEFPCLAGGEPAKGVRDGVLEYRYSCTGIGPLSLRGAHPAEIELAANRKAADAGMGLDAAAALLQAMPTSWLAETWADRIDDAMAAFANGVQAIRATARPGKAIAGGGTPVDVSLSNGARFDATVFYTIGTGRVERLLVERGQSAAIKLVTMPGQRPVLDLLRLMPRLRSAEWLFGAWRSLRATVAIVPGKAGPLALLLAKDAQGLPRMVSVPLVVEGDRFRFAAAVGADFAGRLLGDTDSLPLQCDEACEIRVSGSLTRQDLFESDGRRGLLIDVEVGNRRKALQLQARY